MHHQWPFGPKVTTVIITAPFDKSIREYKVPKFMIPAYQPNASGLLTQIEEGIRSPAFDNPDPKALKAE